MTLNLIDVARGRRKIASRLAIILLTFVSANSASAETRRIQVGTLTCSLSSSIGLVVGSERNVSCTFRGAGLVEEGEEVMSEGRKKDDAPADLALIGAAQRVEHYEIAAYTTARNLALQLRQPLLVQLLTTSLGEEQNAGQLLDQVAQPLMSVAKMPASVE
jgi:Domain of unknown function (DUF892)/Protein of unknown function (DUF992)